jgi:DNA-directed RNA polymerase subunit RPC12/RpoP
MAEGASPSSGGKDGVGARAGIPVTARLSCPRCDYGRVLRNRFERGDVEILVVSMKVLAWLTCPECGSLLDLECDFLI